jgi:[acyl-carrier-protein] S-malonyltransferase
MGRDWAESSTGAREVFAEADEALGAALSDLCWKGPEQELQLTVNAQPAILTASVAAWRGAADLGAGLSPSLVAGHSLGEYTALVAAGALEFADAVRLVRLRGRLMQEAVPAGEGAMAAILGLPPEQVAEVAAEAAESEVCTIANFNAPQQTVLAGSRSAVERALELAKARGARRAVMLAVSAPFHCSLMAPARERLAPRLDETHFSDPSVPVVTNVDAEPVTTGAAAREALVRQVDGAVRWVDSVRWMAGAGGIGRFIELGPGKVLTGLIRRIAPEAYALAIAGPARLAEWISSGEEKA